MGGTETRTARTGTGVVVLVLAVIGSLLFPTAVGPQTGPAVAINELMYNPPSDIDGDEFIELHNPGAGDVDVSGWCVTQAVDPVCFPAASTIPAGGFVVLAHDATQFQATYGFAPDLAWSGGKLSNGGELVQLIDAGGATIDEVVYDDVDPWPTEPDGTGPSLERKNPIAPADNPGNWAASIDAAGHTVGAANSVVSMATPPTIADVLATPLQPQAFEAVAVTAQVDDADSVELLYNVALGADVTLPMADDGASGDGAAGDGVYGATIPGQDTGVLIRYRVEATNAEGTAGVPATGYISVIVGATAGPLPVIDWFIDPADYESMVTDHRYDDTEFPSTLVYDGATFGNATVRVRGNTSRAWPKPNFKFEFPGLFDGPDLILGPVDEFNAQSDYFDRTLGRATLSWESYFDAGFEEVQTFFFELRQNGEFYGLYRFQEALDGGWRSRAGFSDGEFYKADDGGFRAGVSGFDKKDPDDGDYSSIVEYRDLLTEPPSDYKSFGMFATTDMPRAVNYLATSALVHHHDQRGINYSVYFDSNGTRRWQLVPWDLDNTWRYSNNQCNEPMITPACIGNRYMDALFDVPGFEAMYFRRLRSLIDEQLTPAQLEDRYDELLTGLGTLADLDAATWGISSASEQRVVLEADIERRRTDFAAASGQIPPSQSDNPPIVISEIHYNPQAGDEQEFLELTNPSTAEAVDLSGWQLSGTGTTLPGGTVILPGGRLVVVNDDLGFRSRYGSGDFVVVQYDGGVSNGGETIELIDSDGVVIDSVTYDDGGAWPSTPDGDGPSLELTDLGADNSVPGNWAPSSAHGGSPGAVNDPDTSGGAPPAAPGPTPITIRAAGLSGAESMALQIDGTTVAEWSDVGGDFAARQFETFTYDHGAPVGPDQARVVFTNNAPGRDLRVDGITVGSVSYQSEDQYSTGSWTSASGCQPSFSGREILNCTNAAFYYSIPEDIPDPPTCAGLSQEAEDAVLIGNFTTLAAAGASGGEAAAVPEGTGNAWSFGDSTGSASLCFQVDVAGSYQIQTVNQAPDQLSNSFYVEVDGEPAALYDVRASTGFASDQVNDRNGADPVVVDLTAGEHVVTFHHREDGTLLDTVTLQAVAPPAQCLGLDQEAEGGRLTGTMVVVADGSASGGEAVVVPEGTGNDWSAGSESGEVELCFAVPSAGTYRIETTDIAPDQLSNSYWVYLDAGAAWLDDVEATASFATHLVNDRNGANPIEVDLTAGDHTLVFANREDGTTLDRVRLIPVP